MSSEKSVSPSALSDFQNNAGESRQAPRDILSSIGEAVYDWDIVSDRIAWGPNACDVLKVADPSALALGRNYASLMSLESRMTRFEAIARSIDEDRGSGARYHAEYGVLLDSESRNSECVWVEDTGRCFAGPDGRPVRAHGAIRVLAQGRASAGKTSANADLDPLTATLNRTALTDALNRLYAGARPGQISFGMVLLAVDDLSKINRTYGFEAGDAVIAAAASRIRACMRTTDVIARYSGNRFAIVLQNCDNEQIQFAASRFINAITAHPLKTATGEIKVKMRAGAVCAPRDARNTQQLFQHAEEAIEAARVQSSGFVLYTPSLAIDHERLRNQAIVEHLVDALNQRRVSIALQPIVAARTGKAVFHEALMRIRLEDGRELAPASIVPVAEKTGLISLLDQRVLELAVEKLKKDRTLTISVNISGVTAMDPGWLEFARAKLNGHPDVASRLIAEITETCAISDLAAMRERIAQIRETGIRIAMDDFGAGYSSFKNLRGLGIDLLKIDGAFIQNLARSPDDRFFVRTLVDLANHLQIPVVAEWVENQETATLLAEWGVDFCQGAWFGMGVPAESLEPGASEAA